MSPKRRDEGALLIRFSRRQCAVSTVSSRMRIKHEVEERCRHTAPEADFTPFVHIVRERGSSHPEGPHSLV